MPIDKHAHQGTIVTAQGSLAQDTEFLEAMIAACAPARGNDGLSVRSIGKYCKSRRQFALNDDNFSSPHSVVEAQYVLPAPPF
jgi:hypothetical protein